MITVLMVCKVNMNILLVGDKIRILDNVKKLGYDIVELVGNKVEIKKVF